MDEYKHYIRVNGAGIIVHGFSSAFEQQQEGDLALSGEQGRHFQIQLTNERGQHIYKVVSGAMVERTQQELDDELAARPPAPPTSEERLEAAEQALLAMMEAIT